MDSPLFSQLSDKNKLILKKKVGKPQSGTLCPSASASDRTSIPDGPKHFLQVDVEVLVNDG